MLPTADVGVSAAQPSRNLGTAKRLTVARRPAQRAFVRFALGGPPPPGARVVLHLYPQRASRSGLVLRHASDRPWDERAITFRTAPGTGPRTVRTGPLARRRWARIDVTTLVNTSGVVALALAAAGTERVEVASREAGRRLAPKLTIEGGRPLAPAPALAPPLGPPFVAPPVLAPPPLPPRAPVDPAQPCGVAATAPAWEHVVWLVFENKTYADVMGSASAPYFNALAARCAWATDFFAETHPSLPNYIAMTSGGTQGIADNNGPSSHPLAAPSIFSQLSPDGWRALQESMPTPCATSSAGTYAARHNPATYYTDIAAECRAQNVPLGDPPDLSARFTFITPNLCNGMHDCSVAVGDAWLAQWMPKLLDTSQYRAGATAIFITWDEDDGGVAHPIPAFVIAPSVPAGLSDGNRYDHYSLLRTTEEMLGLPPLGAAATALSMREAFHL